jgi:hypothetical protein
MNSPDDFQRERVETILLSYQAQACDLWRVNHAEGASPTERELHELTEALLARRIFELEPPIQAAETGEPRRLTRRKSRRAAF